MICEMQAKCWGAGRPLVLHSVLPALRSLWLLGELEISLAFGVILTPGFSS